MSDIDYWNNKTPKCPHCAADVEIWGTDRATDLDYSDGGRTTFECPSCRKDFVCETATHYTFHTAVSDEAADDEEWGPKEAEAA